jgi:putative DNA primase/helicase
LAATSPHLSAVEALAAHGRVPRIETPPPLRITDPITLQGLVVPERRWLVTDWIPWGHVTALYGDGGTGKSLLAQMLMTAVTVNRSWLDLDTAPCRAFGVFCEDDDEELWRRQADINRTFEVDMGDLADMRWVSRVGEDNAMMEFPDERGELTPFFGQILEAAKDQGAQLVVIDTAADTFGGNENSRPQVRRYISGALGRIAREIDGCVLLCAHPSVAGIQTGTGAGGSTGWNNTVRSRLYFYRPDGEDEKTSARTLTRKKANYAAIGDEVKLRWQDGVFLTRSGSYECKAWTARSPWHRSG